MTRSRMAPRVGAWVVLAASALPRPARAQPPPGRRVDTVRVVVPPLGAPTTRLRGDTLWVVMPGAGFPRDSADAPGTAPGVTDSLVLLFGRDAAGRDAAWRLVGPAHRTRRPVPPGLLALLRDARALAAEEEGTRP